VNLELSGKVALVTGSSRGIGRAIANALHAEGCEVALNGRDSAVLANVASELPGAIAVCADFSDASESHRAISQVVSDLGRLDILVCNIGSGQSVAPGLETPAEWQRMFAVNLWSTINAVDAARDALAATHGAIVCVSSICGLETIPGAPVTYSAAKAALNAYVRGIARPLGRHGIRINAVAPGNILFEGSTWARRLELDPVFVQEMLRESVALERLGTAEEVASLVAYLASPRAGFATGSVWTCDGGQIRS